MLASFDAGRRWISQMWFLQLGPGIASPGGWHVVGFCPGVGETMIRFVDMSTGAPAGAPTSKQNKTRANIKQHLATPATSSAYCNKPAEYKAFADDIFSGQTYPAGPPFLVMGIGNRDGTPGAEGKGGSVRQEPARALATLATCSKVDIFLPESASVDVPEVPSWALSDMTKNSCIRVPRLLPDVPRGWFQLTSSRPRRSDSWHRVEMATAFSSGNMNSHGACPWVSDPRCR